MASARHGSSKPGQAQDIRLVVDTIPTLAWSAHSDGSADFFNQRWLEYAGLSAEQALNWGWKVAIHPDDLPRILETFQEAVGSRKPFEAEGRFRRHDGGYRWFLFRAEQNGQVIRWYGTNTDIEDLKQVESLLAAEKRALEMITDGAGLNDILNHLCSSMDLHVSPSMTTVLLMDPDGRRLWHTAGCRVPREWVPIISPLPVALDAGLCGTAAFLKKRIVVPDVATDPNWPDRLRPIAIKNGIRAGWSEPILTKDRQVLGTFALYAPESRVPTDADLALIEGAGRIALIAIEGQRSQEALRTALDEIRKSEAKLRQDERELRQLIDFLPQHVLVLDAEGFLLQANQMVLDYNGYTLEEMQGAGTDERVKRDLHPDDLERARSERRRGLASGVPFEIEKRVRGSLLPPSGGKQRWAVSLVSVSLQAAAG